MAISRRKIDVSSQKQDIGLQRYFKNIYAYMALALGLTGGVATAIAFGPISVKMFFLKMQMLAVLGTLGIAIYMGYAFERISTATMQFMFWTYALLMGVSLVSIFGIYKAESIARAFFITAGTFGATSIYGYVTKKDLTSIGSFCFMGLIGIIIASLVNVFFYSPGLDFAISFIGLIIFIGLTAYDTQKLKNLYYALPQDEGVREKLSLMGALTLYLDVINIFLFILRLTGSRDSNS